MIKKKSFMIFVLVYFVFLISWVLTCKIKKDLKEVKLLRVLLVEVSIRNAKDINFIHKEILALKKLLYKKKMLEIQKDSIIPVPIIDCESKAN